MSKLQRFLHWLDEAAGGFIRLAYLTSGIVAVASYFGAGSLPPAVAAGLDAALPWTLAAAVETHTYITARRVRAAYQEHDRHALNVNLVILAALLAFSAWNQWGFLAGTWTPPHSALALPLWLAYLVRALVVPALFLCAALLAPMAEPVAVQIEQEAHSILVDVFKLARKQRKQLLQEAEARGHDMTAALVELIPNGETRRIISHAYQAIGASAAEPAIPSPIPPSGGSPVMLVPASVPDAEAAPDTPVVQFTSNRDRIAKLVYMDPTLSVAELAARAGVSKETASKYKKEALARLAATRPAVPLGERLEA